MELLLLLAWLVLGSSSSKPLVKELAKEIHIILLLVIASNIVVTMYTTYHFGTIIYRIW